MDFSFRAWLGDGRTRQPATVRYEPRPAITRQDAWVVLPEYCGLRPSGQRYEMYQPKADISGLPGSSARVVIETQKPVRQATLELIGVQREPDASGLPLLTSDPLAALLAQPHLWKDAPEAARAKGKEIVSRRVPMTLGQRRPAGRGDLRAAAGRNHLSRRRRGRVRVRQPRSAAPPRRDRAGRPTARRTAGGALPRLREPVGFSEEDDVAGIPILLGSKVRIGYTRGIPMGWARPMLVYRINEGEWWRLPLAEVKDDPEPRARSTSAAGCSRRAIRTTASSIHAAPSPDPEAMLGRTLGGGQLDFETAKLPGIKSGDRLEY